MKFPYREKSHSTVWKSGKVTRGGWIWACNLVLGLVL